MPTPAKSWWLHVPLIFTGLSFSKKPLSGLKRMVRMPKGVSYSSTVFPATPTMVTVRYRLGSSSDHTAGLLIVSCCRNSRLLSAGIESGVDCASATLRPSESTILVRTRQLCSESLSLSISVEMLTVARPGPSSEVTNVPLCAT